MCNSPAQPIISIELIIIIIIVIILAYLAYKAVDRNGEKIEMFKDTHKGICKTCQKNKRVNTDEQCFWCWDKKN